MLCGICSEFLCLLKLGSVLGQALNQVPSSDMGA